MDYPKQSVHQLLSLNATSYGDRPAIVSESGVVLTHRGLLEQIEYALPVLNRFGIGRNDRVAIVLPQSSELAVAFLTVAACSTAAPLNHNYKRNDFLFYLEDLQAKALVVLEGDDTPARLAANMSNVPLIELRPSVNRDGSFEMIGDTGKISVESGFAESNDVGLTLHTSGTTSRPKMVPLSQANLCISAANIIHTIGLGPDYRCLNVMPLFHIHGLVACVLASLGAGGNTVCTNAFSAPRFLEWLEKFEPSWYSAVPTMHQAVLGEVNVPVNSSLRFIRSSSAALPPPVMKSLEEIFGVPVIESYGMTEATHQMASNPLPPGKRKPGSVGIAAGPEICILDEENRILSQGETGEISIRGLNVTRGYKNNETANASAFTNGWFRTGDQGYLDSEGYLFLTCRFKEMINRGGENIAPREIDEALLTHAEIKQAVGFAVPHSSLGEDVAAAVILETGSTLDESAIREYAMTQLPDFKVPSRVVILDDIPKGPTGKLQRIGLAEKLKDLLKAGYQSPASETERSICRAYEQVLMLNQVGRQDNFFLLGGDSLRATQVIVRLNEEFGLELPVSTVFRFPSPDRFGTHLDEVIEAVEVEALARSLEGLSEEERSRILDGFDAEPGNNSKES